MERRAVVALVAALVVAVVVAACLPDKPSPTRATVDGAIAPAGDHIRIEVLNASKVHGLARRATQYLRDAGYDVVSAGTTTPVRDSVLIIDRTQHPSWAGRIAREFDGARVESHPDSSRYVDITVLIGATWRPPTKPFYP
jgi:LytR cell envelope-related transcriptional attenuator